MTVSNSNGRKVVSAIAAVAANGVIGNDGGIPWHIPGEQKLFKDKTVGNTVVMGRNTWNSLPQKVRPLPNRVNVMLTSNPDYNHSKCIEVGSVEEAIMIGEAIVHSDETIFIGGQRVYEEALPWCDTLYLTELEAIFPGDTCFPEFDRDRYWTESETYYPLSDKRHIAYWSRVLRRLR